MMLYIDGVLAASDVTVTSAENTSGYWKIGVNNAPYFQGLLDDIRVYDNALAAMDVASLTADTTTVDIEDEPVLAVVSENFALNTFQNPFNPNVSISVTGWKTGEELRVLDINGKVVADLTASLNSGRRGIGPRQVMWNASGRASGVYIIMLRYGKMEMKRKAMLIR
jgi:hypothetical protein